MQEPAVMSPTPDAAPATPVTEPAAANGTVQPVSGDAPGQSAPAEETFLSADPTTLPPQLRQAYENMLRDYKTKTTKLADERKQYSGFEDYRKKAEVYDQLSQDERFVQYWNSQNSPQIPPQPNGQDQAMQQELQQLWLEAQSDPNKAIEFHRKVAQMEMSQLTQKQAEIERKQLESDAVNVVDAFADAVDEKGQKLRPDFDDPHMQFLINSVINQNPPKTQKEWQTAITKAYDHAKSVYQDIFTKGKSAAQGAIQTKAQNSTEKPSTSVGEVYSGSDPKKLTAAEAVNLARKGIRVPKS